MATEGWLLCDGRVLAAVEVARTGRERRMGLLGRDGIDGALLLERCRWVHTVGMRFALDLIWLDADGAVLFAVTELAPHELLARLRSEIEGRKAPGTCVVVPEIPLTRNGKVDRARLATLRTEASRV